MNEEMDFGAADAARRAHLGKPPRSKDPTSRHVGSKLRAYVLERDGFKCRRCGHGSAEGRLLNADHVVPVARGGLTEHTNLQTLCSLCNNGKSDRPPTEHDLRDPVVPSHWNEKYAAAAPKKNGLVGIYVLKPDPSLKHECKDCGVHYGNYWQGIVEDRIGPNTYRVQWFSWLDGSDGRSEVATQQCIDGWYQFANPEDFHAACRWILSRHDHEKLYSWANYGEPEPRRLSLEGAQ